MKTTFTIIIAVLLLGCYSSIAQSGSLDTSFDPGTGADYHVYTTAIQNDGKIIIGGDFTFYNGTARNYIARLNTDGSLDTSFDPGSGANWTVVTSSMQNDGKIIIGGSFTSYNGTAVNHIARLHMNGSLDTSFDLGTGATSTVQTISIQSDGKIIIGGDFVHYNGTPRNHIARLNQDGSLDPSFDPGTGATGSFSTINTTSIQNDGKIIIGGDFTAYNGTLRKRVARLNADGSLDPSFDPGTGVVGTGSLGKIWATSIQSDGKIVVGGLFTSYNGTPISRIARLNVDGSLDMSFDAGTGANGTVMTTHIQNDGRIIIGGWFTTYNGTASNYIARLNTDGSQDPTFAIGTGATSAVYTTSTQSDGKIIIGGWFTSYNGTERNRIARINSIVTGIDQLEHQNGNVKIFPNPFSTTTTLQTEFELRDAALTIFNSSGQAVKHVTNISGHTVILNRDNLPSGLYFVRLLQDNEIIASDKLIITE